MLRLPNMPHPPRPAIITSTTTTIVDERDRSVVERRRGEATKIIGMDMRAAAAA